MTSGISTRTVEAMRGMRFVALVCVVLAGCASPSREASLATLTTTTIAPATTTSTSTTSTTTSTTTTLPASTVQQWASLMIRYRTDAVQNAVDGAPCLASTRTKGCDFVGLTSVKILQLVATGMSIEMKKLRAAGPIPNELVMLISDTVTTADRAGVSLKLVADCGEYPAKCDTLTARSDVGDLMNIIDRWRPYTR